MIKLAHFLALMVSCMSPEFKPDLGLTRDYSFELQNQEPFDIPYVSLFKKGEKELAYLAANHSRNKEGPTFRLVEQAFDVFNPDFVIVEGLSKNSNLEGFKNHARDCFEQMKKGNCAEPSYAAFLSIKNEVPFGGAEPDDNELAIEAASSFGLSAQDVAFFYALRLANQWKWQGEVESNSQFQKKIESYFPRLVKRVGVKQDLDFQTFLNWYKQKSGGNFSMERVKNNDLAPVKEGIWSQKISHSIGVIRERSILRAIAAALNNYNKVLVVYGGGHLVKSRLVLEDMLGDPVREIQSFKEQP